MLGNWKTKGKLLVLAAAVYAAFSTNGILSVEKLFREKNPNNPLTPSVCYLLGNLSYATWRYDLAIELTERNVRDFPYHTRRVSAEFTRARCYEKMGDYQMAIKLYEEFLLDHPRDKRYESIQSAIAMLKIYNQHI